jgi:hypothetical protein
MEQNPTTHSEPCSCQKAIKKLQKQVKELERQIELLKRAMKK